MATLILARHGETDWNREDRFQGHADPPLNALGTEQARTLHQALAGEPLGSIYASPLQRAFQTAEIVAEQVGLPVHPAPGLKEVDVGSWSGLTRTEVEQRFPDGYLRWLDYGHGWEDGETYQELGDRVVAALLRLGAEHDGETVLAVTHGGPIRAAAAYGSGIGFDVARRAISIISNCDVVRLSAVDGSLRLLV